MYARGNTQNNRGWRPTLGQGEMWIDPNSPLISATVTNVPDASSDAAWYDLEGMLREANAKMLALEDEARRDPEVARQFGAQIASARNQYSTLVTEYVRIYTLGFGEPPNTSGLYGLGIAPAAAVIVSAAFVALYLGLMEWHRYTSAIQEGIANKGSVIQIAQAAQAQAQNLRQQAAAAQAQGNIEAARELIRQATMLEQGALNAAGAPDDRPKDFSQWFQNNFGLILLGVGALLIAPPLVKKL